MSRALALSLGTVACLAVGGAPAPQAHDAARNPRRTTPLPPVAAARYRGSPVVTPSAAPGQSARRKRRLARHGKTV